MGHHDPFLAVVERALADANFLKRLQESPSAALAAACLELSRSDLATLTQLAATREPDLDGLLLALVELARQRAETSPQATT